MNVIIYGFIIIVNIFNTIEQIASSSQSKNIENNDNNKNDNSKRIKSFFIDLSLIIILVISLTTIIKLIIKYCKKKYAFKKLYEDYIKNKLMNEEIIDQVKCVYGFNFIISFLKEKIFISSKYNEKNNELKNCEICSICQNNFNLNDKIYITSCNHVYHKICMVDYLQLIIDDNDLTKNEKEKFHIFFQCPNCKEFLFTNRALIHENKNDIEKNDDKINENNVENFYYLKNNDIIISHDYKKDDNITSTDRNSKRNLSAINHQNKEIKKMKILNAKKRQSNDEEIENDIENKNKIINIKRQNIVEGEISPSHQSNMKLKGHLYFQQNNIIQSNINNINDNYMDTNKNEKNK